MNHAFYAAAAVGIGPALLLMFYSLRRYEYPYVKKALFRNDRLFLSFAIGMIFGVASAVLFNAFRIELFTTALIVLLAMALFDESFKLVYLNLKTFQKKFDTVFYGSSLGLGMAATFSMALAFQTFVNPTDPFNPIGVLLLVTLSIALNSLHFFTGTIIAAGSAKGRLWRSYLQSLGSRTVFALLMAPFLAPSQVANRAVLVAFLLAATAFALFLFWEAHSLVIPGSLPADVRRKLRRPLSKERAG
ncbi:MAG: hypothetical protein ACE5HJ_04090 [Thermoplasmata archaeon]